MSSLDVGQDWDQPLGAGDGCPFGLCDGTGFIYDADTNTAYNCRCRPQRVARAKARSLSAVIPRRYRDVSFDRPPVSDMDRAIVAATRRYAATIEDQLDAGRGLWFMGPPGTGKTTLAMLVSKAALKTGRSVAIYSLPRLLNEIRDTHRAERSHVALLDRLTEVDLLHIDDVGAERTTDWVLEELYSIVNGRYADQRSMVITTNILDREALCDQITARTVSRLTEMCDELPLLGRGSPDGPALGVIRRAGIAGLVAVAVTAAGCGGGGHSGQGGGGGVAVTRAEARAVQTCSTAVSRQRPLSGATNRFISTAPNPFGAASAIDGRFGFLTTGRPAIEVISGLPADARVARTVNLSTATQPSGLALTPDGRYLLAANTDGALVFSVARLETGAAQPLLGTLSPPPGPRLQAGGAIEVASSRDGRYVFVSLEGGGRIAVYDVAAAIADGFRHSQLIGTVPVGVAPVGLAVSPDDRWLYATSEVGGPGSRTVRGDRDGTVTAISIPSAERDPAHAAVASVYAGCAPVRVTTARDGSLVLVTARESDELLAYSAAKLQRGGAGALLAAVRVGEAPVGLAVADGGARVVVADSNRFNLPTARTGLTVVDLQAMLSHRPSIVGELAAGAFPRDLAVTPDGRTVLVADFASSQMQVVGVPGAPALH